MRAAVTGIASDFGTVIAPLLLADADVEEVIGIDLRDPRVAHPKLRFEREAFEKARPPRAELRELPGVGHLLFDDHLNATMPVVTGWLRETLGPAPVAAVLGEER